MDRLHRAQRGFKLSIVVAPPFDSGMLCPTWKSNAFILFLHHLIGHFTWNLCLFVFNHTCSRKAFGMHTWTFMIWSYIY